ncbi:unnamed protein product [Lasius platythorax]|uniref:C2H2-type domain-containing protein n=1 Tax=Lasius platythorax TaxID=488582 RepID=A0AAV2NY75_9HYME
MHECQEEPCNSTANTEDAQPASQTQNIKTPKQFSCTTCNYKTKHDGHFKRHNASYKHEKKVQKEDLAKRLKTELELKEDIKKINEDLSTIKEQLKNLTITTHN